MSTATPLSPAETLARNTRLGIMAMIGMTMVFAVQDGLSRHLAEAYNVIFVVMLRYWFFAAFVVALAARRAGGLRAAARSHQPWLQAFRGLLLAAEVCVMIAGFVLLGLVEIHAVFAVYPLMIAALSGPVLGERVGWRRWLAILAGLVGVLIILAPGLRVFTPTALIPFLAATMFAVYGLLTRYVSRTDSAATSLFWTGTTGAAALTLAAPFVWEPMSPTDWMIMGTLCITGVLGHYLLIKAYELAEASAVQPFAYLQLVFASAVGVIFFGDVLAPNVALGAAVVVSAGLFALWREQRAARRRRAG